VNIALPTLKTLTTDSLLGREVLYFVNTFFIEGVRVSFNDKSNLLELFDKYVDISFSIEIFNKLLFDHGKNHSHSHRQFPHFR